MEYALLITKANGTCTIHHINKDIESLDPIIADHIDVRANPMASGKHYFATNKEENPPKDDVSIVEIAPTNLGGNEPWVAKTFQDAYLDFHHSFRAHPGATIRNVNGISRPSLVSFESFINFVKFAYPNDYNRWELVDPDLLLVTKVLAVPK